jgi:D-3-phosphoglycerate dehydrogenase
LTKLLLAGDNFIRNDLIAKALAEQLPAGIDLAEVSLPWPQVPFGRVAEVDEASGTEDDVAEAIGDAEVVITQMAPLTRRVLDRASRLRLVVCTRGGPVNINTEAATAQGVAVSCTPGRNAVAAAEYTLLLMLAALRRLPANHASVVAGHWRSDLYDYDECGGELAGSVVGVIGYGEIGSRVAGMVRALGARVLVHDPVVDRRAVDHEERLVSLPDLMSQSDVVTLHARLTPSTHGMIGPRELALLHPGAVLVNTARGGLLDYDAAAEALKSGALSALALDVYPEEPIPAAWPLLNAPGTVFSPHLAGATKMTAHRAIAIAVAEVERYVRDQPLHHVVNGVVPQVRP